MKSQYYAWIGVAAVIAVAAFFTGRELRPDTGASFDYNLAAPPFVAASPAAGLSKGGFSGFGETLGLDGKTVLSGKVTSVTSESLTLETPAGSSSTIKVTGAGPLRRIEASSVAALRPGVTVVIRMVPGSKEGAAVLIVAEP